MRKSIDTVVPKAANWKIPSDIKEAIVLTAKAEGYSSQIGWIIATIRKNKAFQHHLKAVREAHATKDTPSN